MLLYCSKCEKSVKASLGIKSRKVSWRKQKAEAKQYMALCPVCYNELHSEELDLFNIKFAEEQLSDPVIYATQEELRAVLRMYNLRPSQLAKVLNISHTNMRNYLSGKCLMGKYTQEFRELCYDPVKVRQRICVLANTGDISDHYFDEIIPYVDKQVRLLDIDKNALTVIQYLMELSEVLDYKRLNALLWLINAKALIEDCKFMFLLDCQATRQGPVFPDIIDRFKDWDVMVKNDCRYNLLCNNILKLPVSIKETIDDIFIMTEDFSTDYLLRKLANESVCKGLMKDELPDAVIPMKYEEVMLTRSFREYYSDM